MIALLEELVQRHPALLAEVAELLDDGGDDLRNGALEEEWNFSGGGAFLQTVRSAPLPLDGETSRQRVEQYATRLNEGEPESAVAEDARELLVEAELRTEHGDYHGALAIYALLIDERLRERQPGLTRLLDELLLNSLPALEILLNEVGGVVEGASAEALPAPLADSAARRRWLERLFAFWLKRIDAHSTLDQYLPRVLREVSAAEDLPYLRELIEHELRRYPRPPRVAIVDFALQYRVRALERFLQSLR